MDSLNRKYLITGGSGYLGTELVKRLSAISNTQIISVSRNEGKSVELKEKFPNIEIILGDIADPYTCKKACRDVNGIFHLAAFKHVGLAEKENVRECIKSNILGTINILEETLKTKPDFIIGISSDKAAQVKGVYGATKMIMERLFSEYEVINPNTRYRTVRYGNVLYSTGSVLCKWKEKILKGEPITITNPEATRFFWPVEQAVDLIFDCIAHAKDSTPYVTSMKSISIGHLLEAMMMKYGKVPVNTIGLQIGENLHEAITNDGKDSSDAIKYTTEEILQLI